MWNIEEIFYLTLWNLLALVNPITVATVIYISRKTAHHWTSLIVGTLVYVVSIVLALILLVADEFSFKGMVAVFEYTSFSDVVFGIIHTVFIALWGIVLSAAVLLWLSRRRHYPTRLPTVILWVVLTPYALIVCASFLDWGSCLEEEDFCTEEVVEDFFTRSATFLDSWWQGEEVEYYGYKIHLGSSYLFERGGLDKINPDYSGTSDWIVFVPGASDEVSKLERQCLDEASTCVIVEHNGYLEFTLTSTDPGPGIVYAKLFYHPECDIYVMPYWSAISDERFPGYLERFFSENCSNINETGSGDNLGKV